VGTIALSALAVAALATAGPYAYVSATTNIEMPAEHWRDMFCDRLLQAGILTLWLVAGTAAYQTWRLSEGGGHAIARSLGGVRIREGDGGADGLKLLNVVEEMALATGIRPPAVYLLRDEPGINAFAAGLEVEEAVIGVTQGAVDRLKRHQLQGVIAHEFSHIVNGDMRLNLQLLGVLTGVQAIASVARFLLRMAIHRDEKVTNGVQAMGSILAGVFGAVLWPIGQIGSMFAMMIHAAVNRQREFLADASAVQFTRDPQGLYEAIQILLNDQSGARLQSPATRVASHMFFAADGHAWQRLLDSHPPLEERLRRLDPTATNLAAPAVLRP
jgi:Zn-dependent protease with chaperone function